MLLVKLIEPPCTERYARWCERSVGEIIVYLLLDFIGLQADTEVCMMKEKKRLTKKITAITAMLLCSVLILTGAVPVSAEAAGWGSGGSYRKTSASFYLL